MKMVWLKTPMTSLWSVDTGYLRFECISAYLPFILPVSKFDHFSLVCLLCLLFLMLGWPGLCNIVIICLCNLHFGLSCWKKALVALYDFHVFCSLLFLDCYSIVYPLTSKTGLFLINCLQMMHAVLCFGIGVCFVGGSKGWEWD